MLTSVVSRILVVGVFAFAVDLDSVPPEVGLTPSQTGNVEGQVDRFGTAGLDGTGNFAGNDVVRLKDGETTSGERRLMISQFSSNNWPELLGLFYL